MGLRLIQKHDETDPSQRQVYYLSTSDYIQHKHAPGSEGANEFYSAIDKIITALDEAGAVIGLTADHGMNEKVRYDGSPRVVMLEDVLKEAGIPARVVLPITDPYVVHHGSLGSYATVYVNDKKDTERAMAALSEHDGVYTVMGKAKAALGLELPADRIGDFIICGDENTVLGKSAEYHDLNQVPALRSHGGLMEQTVPMFFNRPLKMDYARKLTKGKARNLHLFDFLLNGMA